MKPLIIFDVDKGDRKDFQKGQLLTRYLIDLVFKYYQDLIRLGQYLVDHIFNNRIGG